MLTSRVLVFLSFTEVTGFVSHDNRLPESWITLNACDMLLHYSTYILLPGVIVPSVFPGNIVSVDLKNDFFVSSITVMRGFA